jgi:hypothetical protein
MAKSMGKKGTICGPNSMRMGELKRGERGQKFCQKMILDECDKGGEMNPME